MYNITVAAYEEQLSHKPLVSTQKEEDLKSSSFFSFTLRRGRLVGGGEV